MRDYSRLDATALSRDRIAGLRALVVGAGALGNEVIKNLALIGVHRLLVLDRDRIEASNLTRSILFCTPDIQTDIARGTPKAELAARRAMEINPDVTAIAHVGEIADLGSGIIRQADIVFSCLDNEMARLELGWVCNRLNKPLIDGGLGVINPSSGLVSLFPGAAGPCYACRKGSERRRTLLQELQGREDPCGLKERLQQERNIVATTPTMASIVAALQVEMGIRSLAEAAPSLASGVSLRMTVNPRISLERLVFQRSPTCPLHDPESVIGDVVARPDRLSTVWTADELLAETAGDAAFLQFDWPITARASCHGCGHKWEPLMRRARFRLEKCPSCASTDVVETEVLAGVSRHSPWAARPLAALGLPSGHIHEVVLGSESDARRRHVEVAGDFIATADAGQPW